MSTNKFLIALGVILYFPILLFAQPPTSKNIEERSQVWFGYFNQARFSNKLGIWFDAAFRTNDFMSHAHQAFVRPGLTYYLNDNIRLTAGYTFAYNFASIGNSTNWSEHRPWQQIWWRQDYNGYQTIQWLRFEQRFVQKVIKDELSGDYNFNYRLRYNFLLNVPLIGKEMKKPNTPYFVVQDEIFINFGREVLYNYFDQNRFFVGFGYVINAHLHFNVGYLNVFQQRNTGIDFYNTHALRVTLFHTLDFRK